MKWQWLDQRPLIVAIAGPNGGGKITFFHAHIARSGLRFVNADVLAGQLEMDAYLATTVAASLRKELVTQRESFAFETIFSDPVGDKLTSLKQAAHDGYNVVLCFIGLEDAVMSDERVAMHVAQGGHDVPHDKLMARFPRTLRNLQNAIAELPHVIVYDNSDLSNPYRQVAVFEFGRPLYLSDQPPGWLRQSFP